MLSIIIPTLNEEDYLPLLLESIKRQNFNILEIIIADAGSKDRTIEIARSFACKVIPGGSPAKGRNEGAKIAQGDLLLFLDADVILPDKFLERNLVEFEKRKLAVASFFLEPLTKKPGHKFLFNFFYNRPIRILEKILTPGCMGILIKKSIHQQIKGFNEEIKIGEDHYYVRQAAKFGKFGLLTSIKLLVSTRRFEEDGWVKTGFIYLLAGLHRIFLGEVKSDVFKYRFSHYTKNKK